ncbi:phosphatidylinositol-specific phospholipase C/glycerophosphodiester phosphodiesterase family protein [Rudanella lutea]|uniref:phosphatidylinositol-specific phospholipase C/glycerophosphodiester phosphodiesterase family protein n=1 Tax=Rudanella lutea TaxID=451374 RepID=UPI0003A57D83|nr:phosphatidylinositol-specific phospholipase C/glycerophosphodiester phosphodiesterase family protein [Rudanella lutea]
MKTLLFWCLLLCISPTIWAQRSGSVKIHAHNDYEKPVPLMAALENRADFIEADIWLVDGKLMVAHDRKDINPARTLDSLYLNPIVRLFAQNGGRISSDRTYRPALVIDLKDKFDDIWPVLQARLAQNIDIFNPFSNPNGIQVIISGSRPKVERMIDYPLFVQFDGRPTEIYDDETVRRVALISDSFYNYSRWDGNGDLPDADREKLKRMIRRAHDQNKMIRFWATPDNPNAWKQLRKLGVDVLNTDKVAECRKSL